MPYYTPPNAIAHPQPTGGALTLLRSRSTVKTYLSHVPLTAPYVACQSAGAAVAETMVAFQYYNITHGSMSDVRAGMTIWVGSTPGARDVGVFRLRKDPDIPGTTLYIAEEGSGSVGLESQPKKIYYIEAGTYVTIWLVDLNIWASMPRITLSGGTPVFFKDYDVAYTDQTRAAPPILNLGPHIARFADDTGHLTWTFTPQIWAWSLTSSPTTFAWTLPAGATLISGSLSTSIGSYPDDPPQGDVPSAAITVQFPVGFHVIKCLAATTAHNVAGGTTGNGLPTEAWRYIWVHDTETFPPIAITEIQSDTRTQVGREMTLTFNDLTLATARELGIVHVWEDARFEGATNPAVISAFTGWIVERNPAVSGGVRQTSARVVGPAALLNELPGNSNRIDVPTTNQYLPNSWQEVPPPYCVPEYMCWYLLRYHVVNYLKLFDLFPFARDTSFAFQTPGLTVPRGTVGEQIKTLLDRAGVQWGCDSSGAMNWRMHPSYIIWPYRTDGKVPTQITLDPSWYTNPQWTERQFAKVRRVDTSGYYLDSGTPTPVQSAAPALAQAQGTQDDQWNDLLVIDQMDLNGRTGLRHARLNNRYENLTLTLPGNIDVIEPAWLWYVRTQLPTKYNPLGVDFDERCIPVSVTKLPGPDGVRDIQVELEVETVGRDGVTVPIVPRIDPPPPPPPPPPGTKDVVYDFTTGELGWHAVDGAEASGWTAPYNINYGGVYVAGNGYETTYNSVAGMWAISITRTPWDFPYVIELELFWKDLPSGQHSDVGVEVQRLDNTWYFADAVGGSGAMDTPTGSHIYTINATIQRLVIHSNSFYTVAHPWTYWKVRMKVNS